MMSRKHARQVGHDLRNICDRRVDDVGPPMGWKERRRNVERRMPTVNEDEISQTEWLRRFACFVAQRRIQEEEIRKAFEALESRAP
jgi:hypothetical protein